MNSSQVDGSTGSRADSGRDGRAAKRGANPPTTDTRRQPTVDTRTHGEPHRKRGERSASADSGSWRQERDHHRGRISVSRRSVRDEPADQNDHQGDFAVIGRSRGNPACGDAITELSNPVWHDAPPEKRDRSANKCSSFPAICREILRKFSEYTGKPEKAGPPEIAGPGTCARSEAEYPLDSRQSYA